MKKTFVIIVIAAAMLFAACTEAADMRAGSGTAYTDTVTKPAETAEETDNTQGQSTQEPVRVTEGASGGADDPIPSFDPSLTVLVNFENPISNDPPVVLIAERLTAGNVTCDERRHADWRAVAALDEMLNAAAKEGDFDFVIASAYRLRWEQELLWNNALAEDPDYGKEPHKNPVGTMPPDCSEHRTGLAFDILCESCPRSSQDFINTSEGRWLAENAARFGFILRYPADKQSVTGVKYEPWHYRFVGKDAALYITERGLCLEEFDALRR